MLRSLRGRLIASHVGLLLILIPLLGVALIYTLESQVVLPNLARQLTGQAVLVAELLKEEPDAMRAPEAAAGFVRRISPLFPGELTLFDSRGVILATSDPNLVARIGQIPDWQGLHAALGGRPFSRVEYSRQQQAELARVSVPVLDDAGNVVAVVRIADYLSTAQLGFAQLRTWTAGVLAGGLILGALIGLILAVTVERPLLRLTDAVQFFPARVIPMPSPDEGPHEVRVLAQAFAAMSDRIRGLEENRRYLLSNIVHELGRPLGAVRAAGRALLDGAADDRGLRDDLLTGMDGEIGRMEGLLEELSSLHDQGPRDLELRTRPVVLAEWLAQLLGPWRAAAEEAGLQWEATLPAAGATAVMDPDRMSQALGNLLSNAIKFTPAGGTLTVSSALDAGAWTFSIRDTGPGIPESSQARIFEPFYRNPPDRHYPQGLGVGLTIARDIVRGHGGEITLDSTPGRGACFTVRIPL